jgi:hypothetical protein
VPTLIEEYDRDRAIHLRARWLMVGVVVAIVGVFLTGPLGVLRVVDGDGLGWLLVAAAVVLAVAAILLFRASRRAVPAQGYRITADASQQPDPEGAPIWTRKEIGWSANAIRQWNP